MNRIFFLLLLSAVTLLGQAGKKSIYLDPAQPLDRRIQDLIGRLTLAEKVSQLSHEATAIDRLGIPAYHYGNEAVHGVKAESGVATVFPHAIAMAATWNAELIFRVSTAISDEARARYHAHVPNVGLTFWSPTINIGRDPRWGRTHEGYGEDPYLTSRIAVAFVKGLQGHDPRYLKAIASPKHYAANNEEWRRHTGSAQIDETLLREYYLPHFQAVMQEGRAFSIMAAYNAINGVPCCCSKLLLTDILRGEWGFQGYTVSDCGGVRDIFSGHHFSASMKEAVAMAMNAGLDMDCGEEYRGYLLAAVQDGMVAEKTVDQALYRVLSARFRLGDFDPPVMVPYSKIPMSVVDSPKHRELAREVARQSIVLLKNENRLLPLDKNNIRSIAVIGPNADVCQFGGYTGKYSYAVTPLQGMKNKFEQAEIKFTKGCDINMVMPAIPAEQLRTADGRHGLTGEYYSTTNISGRATLVRVDEKIDFDWERGSPDARLAADSFSVRWTGKFIPDATGDYYFGATFDDEIRIFLDGEPFLIKWNNRNKNTAVKTMPVQAGRPMDVRIEYAEHWYKAQMHLNGMPVNPDQFKDAVAAARTAEVAVIFAGTDASVEDEGVDRSDLVLPGIQQDLIKAIVQANPATVLVLINGSPLAIDWAQKNVPAIIEAWYPGEEGGNAIADVLAGDYNPAGRLPMTFYQSVEQLPDFSDYDIRKGRTYKAEIRRGGVYTAEADSALFPFGYGLSYTQFRYSDLRIDNKGGSVRVAATVENTGACKGDEVVQMYIQDERARVPRPLQELKGFQRITLKPGEKKTVEFILQPQDLQYWDSQKKKYIFEPGRFLVFIGSSSRDRKLTGSFELAGF